MGSELTIEALREELMSIERELAARERRRAGERQLLEERIDVLAEQAAGEAGRADRLSDALAVLESELAEVRRARDRIARELRQLEAEVARRERGERRQAQRLARDEEFLVGLTAALREVRADVERVGDSTAWRLGHRLARTADRVRMRRRVTAGAVVAALDRLSVVEQSLAALRAAERAEAASRLAPGAPAPEGLDAAARVSLARRIRSRLGPVPRRASWPSVSIVVLNRNGEEHLRRLLPGLAELTDYPRFELILVDNASTDGSLSYVRELTLPFPLTVIENEENVTFSAGNNQGADRATGDLLLLLNNDIEPFEGGWLRELVALCLRPGIGAAGATLLHASELADGEPLVQHRGIRVRQVPGRLAPYNLDEGGALFDERFGVDVDGPATTGACLMVRREAYLRLGGLPDGYRYGTEDVDLGLQLVAGGARVVTSGRAHLLHRESSTQDAQGRAFKRENRLNNQRLFAERWGPRLRREYRVSRLRGDPYWADGERPLIAITLTSVDQADGWGDWYTGHELGEALERIGWRVAYVQRKEDQWYLLPDGLDYLLVLLDSYDLGNVSTEAVKIAWVRSWTERWIQRPSFGAFDLVLASSSGSARMIEQRTGVRAVDFPLATNAARFRPVPADPQLAADCVFTGNHWRRDRAIQQLHVRAGETFKVFGSGWEEVPELAPHAQGPIPYDRLPAVYSSAKVVIDDTAEHTLPYGAVNSRVFDALACGAVVLTNCQEGVHELFDADFPTWSDPESLRAGIDRLLADEPGRTKIAQRYARIVRERHTYDVRARQLETALIACEERLSFCIKTGAPNRSVAPEWGDVHFAEAVARELRRRGHRAIVQTLDEWEDLAGLHCDVVVHLKGLSRYTPKPGQFNVLWNISHPDLITIAECEAYQLVCVASQRFADDLRARCSTPVAALEQATDPRLFYPDADPALSHELLFVANSRKVMRRMMADLLPTTFDLAVYGTNWEGLIEPRYIAGEHIPNAQLRRAYSSAAIVLNDHWDDMRAYGFVSNRVYDALACGAVVLSDHMPELEERFGDAVVAYSDAAELPGLIDRLLRSPDERAARGARGRELVLSGYTFSRRVDELLALLSDQIGGRWAITPSGAPAPAEERTGRGGGLRLPWRGSRPRVPVPDRAHRE